MYKITIVEIKEEVKKGKVWQKLSDAPNSSKQYGYVENEEIRENEREIYRQVIDKIDLREIIDAVNSAT